MGKDENSNLGKRLYRQITCFLVTIRFLTIVPFLKTDKNESDYFKGALFFFGPTGMFIGILAALLSILCTFFFPPAVNSAILVIFLSTMSGFIHLDGLADTADGFLSGKPREACLEIMRDSRIGVMGAVIILSVFMVKYSSISSISPDKLVGALILAPMAGRTAIVLSMATLPYARKEGGLGELFYSSATIKTAVYSILFLIVISVAIDLSYLLPLVFSLFITVAIFSAICRKKIGGATGDTLGAVCELTEALFFLVMTKTF